MNGTIYETIVVGAGHAGLSASYYLRHLGLEHIVFERGRIGESWRSQRWDNFRMITKNSMNVLPGSIGKLKAPDQFGTGIQFANSLREYVNTFELPVSESSEVTSIEKSSGSPIFTVKVSHDNEIVRSYDCWQVIVASGMTNTKDVPHFSSQIAPEITQVHSSGYSNAWALPAGAVLVVGSGQSGCQITEDLIAAGRKVFLSTSLGRHIPRSYRGKDILEWMQLCKLMDAAKSEIVESAPWMLRDPVVATEENSESDLTIHSLANQGAIILGRLSSASGTTLSFDNSAPETIHAADEYSASIKQVIDDYIKSNQLQAPEYEIPLNIIEPAHVSPLRDLSLVDQGIGSIVWATGLTGKLDYIHLPVFNNDGTIIQQQGVTPVEGLYVIGLPWQRSQKSNFIFGIKDDAGFVTSKIYSALR